MQTILLAAGQGTRMRPLTDHRAKPMLPVVDKPLAAHTATTAVNAGASRLIIVVGYESEAVREYFGDEYAGVPVNYAVQSEQRGTADAVRAAEPHLDDGQFAVLNGDALYDEVSLTQLFENAPAVGSYRVDDPTQYGVLYTAEDDTRATGVIEKPADPPSNLINTGAYVFPAAAQSWLEVGESERGELELTDVLERACTERTVSAVPFERWLDVGRPWELLEANEWKLDALSRSLDGEVHEDANIRGDVVVESGATVDAGVVIEGPALVREGAAVGPNAYVRGHTLIARDATVGHSVEVKNSIFMQGATVGHLSYIGDSILGRDVNFGASTTVANLRHDDEPVRLQVKGEATSTGRRKFGVVCGDNVKTGIQTSLNAGVKLASDVRTTPGEVVLEEKLD
ncbi:MULTISPECIES: bifunctional sugar-1-phosphate nucleotidylyltransferase/acetyltransferase [Haloferax]|uniref:bifunctional sugar-1-phosphate nucleotidylyltransferase/acetyltransferase n=1 Tax=Haloferax TaxID=2251 RepID=UPI000E287A98|nr:MULTISPECIES: bifunctional sugar-1-phosphate nucleotidylyltransferase/acetyltransferase [Haloferax]RDZ39006.1 glucose-1-phosphate thymidylyltransferase [Haloferax sp. Atlit-47N]WEL30214.1 Glucose-1-phosphate thymidylyltransferase [Haloferax alexandrinus]